MYKLNNPPSIFDGSTTAGAFTLNSDENPQSMATDTKHDEILVHMVESNETDDDAPMSICDDDSSYYSVDPTNYSPLPGSLMKDYDHRPPS